MAHAFKWVVRADRNGWDVVDPLTGENVAAYTLPANEEQLANVALYGLKQLVADGGAKDKGTSRQARKRAMDARYNSLIDGTWNMRDGIGGGGLPDADVYRAAIALGIATDNDERRAMWKKIGAPARLALRNRADVAEWLKNNIVTPDADDALDAWMNT